MPKFERNEKRRKVVFLTKIECSNNGLLGKRVEKHLDFTFKREEKRMLEVGKSCLVVL